MIRKVIQIVAAPKRDSDCELYALCNDGTLWAMTPVGQWVELPAIPQSVSHDPMAKLHAEKVDLESTITAVQDLADKYTAHVSPIVNDIGREIHAAIVTSAINNEEGDQQHAG